MAQQGSKPQPGGLCMAPCLPSNLLFAFTIKSDSEQVMGGPLNTYLLKSLQTFVFSNHPIKGFTAVLGKILVEEHSPVSHQVLTWCLMRRNGQDQLPKAKYPHTFQLVALREEEIKPCGYNWTMTENKQENPPCKNAPNTPSLLKRVGRRKAPGAK